MPISVVKGRGLLLLGGLFSLAVHGLIWQFLQREEVKADAQMAPNYAPMRVSVSLSAPAALQEPLPQKAKSKQPKQIAKPLLKPVEKTPVVKRPEVKKPEVKKEAAKKAVSKKAIPTKASPKAPITTPVQTPLTIEGKTVMPLLSKTEQKNQLIAELMRRIEQNKHYPKRALKRGIEGQVRFTLVLDRAGQLQSFEWLEGNRLFYKSTLDAVKRSLPLKLSTEQQPLNHQLALQYQIRR